MVGVRAIRWERKGLWKVRGGVLWNGVKMWRQAKIGVLGEAGKWVWSLDGEAGKKRLSLAGALQSGEECSTPKGDCPSWWEWQAAGLWFSGVF